MEKINEYNLEKIQSLYKKDFEMSRVTYYFEIGYIIHNENNIETLITNDGNQYDELSGSFYLDEYFNLHLNNEIYPMESYGITI